MSKDFFAKLNDSNSIRNDDNNEIIINCPIIEADDNLRIENSLPFKIKSTCNTVIKCHRLKVLSESISFIGFKFKSSIKLQNANNFELMNCSIEEHKSSHGGIEITNSQNITIKHVTISNLQKPGIHIKSRSSLSADDLTIRNIKTTMFVCFEYSSVKITNSKFYNSTANGILSDDESSIEILNSTFSDFQNPAVFIENSKSAIIKNNKFEKIEQNGLSITSSHNFSIENNEFTQIQASAISISKESVGEVTNNKVFDIGGNGIICSTSSNITIKNNKFNDLIYPAISIASNSTATLDGNKITGIKYSGIALRRAKYVKIENCEIQKIIESGISISDTERCEIEKNKITYCGVAAVEGYNKSTVTATTNLISNIEKYAFLSYTSGNIKAEKNKIDNIKICMAKLAHKGGGYFVNNDVSNCPIQCDCKTSSLYFFNGNGQFKGVTNDVKKKSDSVVFDASFNNEDDNNLMCLKCNRNKRDCFLVDCGHKVYCKSCADKALKNKEFCPLCRFPIIDMSVGFEATNDNMCIICFDNKVDAIVLPCGHMCVCSTCLENWFKNNQTCPYCRMENSFYKNI